MAAHFLRSLDPALEVLSAGTSPALRVQPLAVVVMREIGVDLSAAVPVNIDRYLDRDFDYVITVCDRAKETCPVFTGNVRRRLHFGFDDPTFAPGTENERLDEFRRVRDEIRTTFTGFYDTIDNKKA